MSNWMHDSERMQQLHGRLTQMVMAQHDQWQTARISRFERISRAEINTQRDLEEIMERLDSCGGFGDEAEKKEIARRRKRKFLHIAVPHGILTGLCIIFCVVFLVQKGNQIGHGEKISDYLAREEQLSGVLSTIHHEFESLSLTLCDDGRGGDLSQTYDITDEKIENFLPDKNLVKWTILNLLRDYRSSDPASGSVYVRLVKHANFYTKVVLNLRYTVQNEELGFGERDGWKLAYDMQLKTRQYFNIRMLISTLRALNECFLTDIENHELFTTLETFVTDLCSLLGRLNNGRTHLSLSYTVLSGLHRHIVDQFNSTSSTFALLYTDKEQLGVNISATGESRMSNVSTTADINGTTSPTVVNERVGKNNTEQDDANIEDSVNSTKGGNTTDMHIVKPLSGNNTDIDDENTVNSTSNGNIIDIHTGETPAVLNEGNLTEHTDGQIIDDINNGTTSPTKVTITAIINNTEVTSKRRLTIPELHGLLEKLEREIYTGIQDNLSSQKGGNESVTRYAVLSFVVMLLILLLVLSLTALFVSILRMESELVIGVGDWLKHLTTDLNSKRDELYGIGRKIIPQSLLVEVDFHYNGSTMVPYYNKETTFLMFSISRFTSYFAQFTTAQTIHILTLVMELVDERIEQYDVISVTCMGERQIVFSDKSYSQRAQHASEIANLALDIMSCCSDLEIGRQSPHSKLHVTIGIHTGPCIGMLYSHNGILKYVVTGHTISVLRKVHKTAVPNRVQITEPTFKLLEPLDTYSLYIRGNIKVKDFSVYKVYWLNGRRISTGTSDCESMRSRIGSWFEMERKPLYRLDEIEGVYEPIDKHKSLLYTS